MAAQPIQVRGHQGWAHDEGHASGTFHTFDALDLGDGPRKIHVFLPREVPGPLPVAYLHDGDAVFWPGGAVGQTLDAAGVLDRMGPGRPPMILVAIHPRDRNAEYTHTDWAEGTRSWGALPRYTRYLAESLKPFIDASYPTRPDPAHTAVIGSSHGGLAAFWQATRRPDRFGFAGCQSPSFFSGLDRLVPGGQRAAATLRESALVAPVLPMLSDSARRPRVWLDWGLVRVGGEHNSVVEALAAARGREMAALLEEVGYQRADLPPGERPPPADLWVQADPSGQHDEPSWQRRLPSVLRAFASGWSARL